MAKIRGSRSERAPSKESREAAETLAVSALKFLAAEPERLSHFLAMTGTAPQSIRDAAREPDFLAGILDHIAGDEDLLLAFAEETGNNPNEVIRAHNVLSGRHWERELP